MTQPPITPPNTPANDHALHPEVNQRRAVRPQASVWVAANAGTGKTKVLIDRVLALMLAGSDPHEILCLTFTKAAAAEMSQRIAKILGDWTTYGDEALDKEIAPLLDGNVDDATRARARQLFARVLDAPGGMNIQTIHAFCQSLLGRFPIEAGVAPHFSVMDERDAKDMLASAYETLLIRARAQGEDGPLERALAQVTRHVNESDFAGLMAALANARSRLKKLFKATGGADKAAEILRAKLGLKAGDTPTTIVVHGCEEAAFDKLGLTAAAQALADGTKTDKERSATLSAWLVAREADRPALLETYVKAFLVASGDQVRKTLATKKVAEAAPGAIDALTVEAERLLAIKMKLRAAVTLEATEGLLHLGAALLDAYEAEKRNAALLDYDDLILAARDLLQRPDTAPWVLYKLDGGITHVLVDEAQDTNPEQWDVVGAITDEFFSGLGTHEHAAPRTVFAVGDVKQSIYSFQGADPAAFRAMRERFRQSVPEGGGLWDEVPLIISFRSVPAILTAVDAVFQGAAADGVDLDGNAIEHKAWRAGEGGVVEVWPPVEPEDTDAPMAWKPPVERVSGASPQTRLAQKIATSIHGMIDGGDILASQDRPVRAGDVMVLVRRRTGFVEDLVRELKRLGIDVAGVDRMVLTDQIAVMDLIALGRFLLLPEDDLTLACVLKSPLMGLDEDDLFALAHSRTGSLWQRLEQAAKTDARIKATHDDLSALRAMADYTPPFELYAHVLGPAGGRKKLVARLGVEALDPIAEFLGLALQFERGHVASLEGFLHWVEAGGVEIKRDLEESPRDAVRIMTVHGAKGLQAPIVFLPDTLQAPGRVGPLLWPKTNTGTPDPMIWPPAAAFVEDVAAEERERLKALQDQEYRRLLYVAMTRAEDRLYVAGWHTKNKAPEDCWYNLITRGLKGYPDTVEDEDGTLRLETTQTKPPKDKTDAEKAAPDFSETLPPFATRPPAPEPTPERPLRPSQMEGAEAPVRAPFDADDGGNRFKRGLLVHRLLEMLPPLAPDARAAAARTWLARPTHGLDETQQAAIAAEALGVLNHPDFAPLFGPNSRAEVSITGRMGGLEGGPVISGQVDRLVVGDDHVTVIDYKTNRPPPTDEAQVPALYLRQMATYRAVLQSIYPQKRVTCVLLWTDEMRLMELSGGILDTYAPETSEGVA